MGIKQTDIAAFKKQMGVVQEFLGETGDLNQTRPTTPYEDQAALMETEALGQARQEERETRERARSIREDREQNRAQHNTRWGQSGVAMSGSRQLVQDARKTADREKEEDMRFAGSQQEKDIISKGRLRANMHRIKHGGSARRSTLSLGSNIYSNRR